MSSIQTVLGGDGVNVITQQSDAQQIQTTVANENINVITQVADVPQIQTTVSDAGVAVSSVVNAPFIEVTSVNGMTGDVNIQAKAEVFKARSMYEEGALIVRDGKLYVAKKQFTTGNEFNADDWTEVRATTTRADWAESDEQSESFIRNKPVLASVATSGSYNDLGDKPALDLEAVLSNGNEADKDISLTAKLASNGLEVSDGDVSVSGGNAVVSSGDGTYVELGGSDWIKGGLSDANGNHSAEKTLSDRIHAESIIYFKDIDELKSFLKTSDCPKGEWVAAVREDDSEQVKFGATCTIGGSSSGIGAVDMKIVSRTIASYGMIEGGPGVGDTAGYQWDTITLKRSGDYRVDFNYVMSGGGADAQTTVSSLSFTIRRNGTAVYQSSDFSVSWNSDLNALVATGGVDIDGVVQAGDEFVPNYGESSLASGSNMTMDGEKSYIIIRRKDDF